MNTRKTGEEVDSDLKGSGAKVGTNSPPGIALL